MSRPERRRPGAQSPLLVAQVESVRTGPVSDAPHEPAPAEAPSGQANERQQEAIATSPPSNKVLTRTFQIAEGTVKRAETAVILRAGGYTSMKAFVNGALQRELARLEAEYGQEFPPNNGEFQRGRPLGS